MLAGELWEYICPPPFDCL